MSHVHLTKEDLIGSYEWKGIVIGAAREKAQIILNMYRNGFTAEQIDGKKKNNMSLQLQSILFSVKLYFCSKKA